MAKDAKVFPRVVVSITAAAVADTGSTDPATDRVLRVLCRIFAGNARGSGVIFDCDEDNYHVLTGRSRRWKNR